MWSGCWSPVYSSSCSLPFVIPPCNWILVYLLCSHTVRLLIVCVVLKDAIKNTLALYCIYVCVHLPRRVKSVHHPGVHASSFTSLTLFSSDWAVSVFICGFHIHGFHQPVTPKWRPSVEHVQSSLCCSLTNVETCVAAHTMWCCRILELWHKGAGKVYIICRCGTLHKAVEHLEILYLCKILELLIPRFEGTPVLFSLCV